MSQAAQLATPPASEVRLAEADAANLRTGLCYGIATYTWWGLVSVYFKALAHVPPAVVVGHRVVWSVLLLAVLIHVGKQWGEVRGLVRQHRVWPWLLLTTVLIGVNWLVFVYSVATGRLVESSLGYFIIPLFTVVLGMVFLGERLRRAQAIAVAFAAAGLTYLTIVRGGLPWIAVVLATTFGTYGLIRKRSPVGPMIGLFVETALLAPAGLAYLLWAHRQPDAAAYTSAGTLAILSLSGVITTLPMLWFVAAVKRLPFVTLSFLQYINPTLQFLMAVVLFGEPFGQDRLVAFTLIWIAIGIFVMDTIRRARAARRAA